MSKLKAFTGNKKKQKKPKPKLNRTFNIDCDVYFNAIRKERLDKKNGQ